MVDPSLFDLHDINNDARLYKKIKGNLILQTDFTENPFIYLGYSYYLDKNTYLYSEKNFEFYFQRNSLAESNYETQFRLNSINNFQIVNIISNNDFMKININKDSKNSQNIKFDFTINDSQLVMNRRNYFFIIKSTYNYVSIIPFKLYEKTISLLHCFEFSKNCSPDETVILKSINRNSENISIDYGMVSTTEAGKKYIKIYNANPVEIMITDIEISSVLLGIHVESITNIKKDILFTGDFSKLYNMMKKKVSDSTKDEISFSLARNSISTICIKISSEIEQDFSGHIKFYFNKNVFFAINIKSKVIKGNLNITPSIIRFEPAFPGLFQTKLISSKSSYNIPINVKSFKSGDHRFTPVLLTNTIISNNRTEIIKVIFDPSKVQTDVFNIHYKFLNRKTL